MRDLSVKRNQMEKAHRLRPHTVPLRSIAGTLTWSAQVGGKYRIVDRANSIPSSPIRTFPHLGPPTRSFKRVIRYMRCELGRGSRHLISKYQVDGPNPTLRNAHPEKDSKKDPLQTGSPRIYVARPQ